MENLIENFSFHRYEGKTMLNKSNPRRVKAESRGDTIVSLLYAAAAGDLSALKTHKVIQQQQQQHAQQNNKSF